ncbi:putative ABC-2 type transporter [Colletotrichum sublineola]|uniref:Putative ABC-2 type transporter n=1 Tax=Colletotrichum sublineola TaxID=1173701 RepID=A0A066XRF5_COLSU|nr:putative ABC-2 type transporter [Colletotrichum sublineola]
MESDGMLVDGSNYELSIKFGNFPYHAIWSLKHKVEAVRHRRTLRFPSPRAWCEMTEPHGAGPCSYASTHENMLTQFNIPKLGCTSITGDVHYGSMTAEEAQRPDHGLCNPPNDSLAPARRRVIQRRVLGQASRLAAQIHGHPAHVRQQGRALEYTKAVRARTDVPGLASIVILNQAGNGIYNLFDELLVLDNIKEMYYGPKALHGTPRLHLLQ